MSARLPIALLALTLGCSPGGVVPEGDSGVRDIGDSTGIHNGGSGPGDSGGDTGGTTGGGTDGGSTDGGGGSHGGGTDGGGGGTDGGGGGTDGGGGDGGGGDGGGGDGGGGDGGGDGGDRGGEYDGEYTGDLSLDIYTDWGDFSLADCDLIAKVNGEDLGGTALCQLDLGWFRGGGSSSSFDFYGTVSERGMIEGELAIDPGRGDPFVLTITGSVYDRTMWLSFSGLADLGGFETEVGGDSLLVRTD